MLSMINYKGNMLRLLKYIKYYFEPDSKEVRKLAYAAAKKFYNVPLRNDFDPYPRVSDYDRRREDFLRYQRAFNDRYRHDYAKNKLNKSA